MLKRHRFDFAHFQLKRMAAYEQALIRIFSVSGLYTRRQIVSRHCQVWRQPPYNPLLLLKPAPHIHHLPAPLPEKPLRHNHIQKHQRTEWFRRTKLFIFSTHPFLVDTCVCKYITIIPQNKDSKLFFYTQHRINAF